MDVTFLGLADSAGPGYDISTLTQGRDPRVRRRRRLNDLRAAPWSRRPGLAAGFLWHRSVAATRHRLGARSELNAGDAEVYRAAERSLRDHTPLPREFRAPYAIAHYGWLSITYRPARSFDGSIASVAHGGRGLGGSGVDGLRDGIRAGLLSARLPLPTHGGGDGPPHRRGARPSAPGLVRERPGVGGRQPMSAPAASSMMVAPRRSPTSPDSMRFMT